MANPMLLKAYAADGAVTAKRIAKFGSADGQMAQAGAGEGGVGVFEHSAADGKRVDVMRMGVADVEYGGTVARGDELTSDATGRAVTRSALTQPVVGVAEVSGVVGDIGSMLISVDGSDGT